MLTALSPALAPESMFAIATVRSQNKARKVQWFKVTIIYSSSHLRVCRGLANLYLAPRCRLDPPLLHMPLSSSLDLCTSLVMLYSQPLKRTIQCTSTFEAATCIMLAGSLWGSHITKPKVSGRKEHSVFSGRTSKAHGQDGGYMERRKIWASNSRHQCMPHTGGLLGVNVWLRCSFAFPCMGPFPSHRTSPLSGPFSNLHLSALFYSYPKLFPTKIRSLAQLCAF